MFNIGKRSSKSLSADTTDSFIVTEALWANSVMKVDESS